GDGTLTYMPNSDFHGVDSFTYTISDGNGGTATGRAIIVVAPVGDTPQVTNASTSPDVQSGLIFIDRHASDGSEVTHFKISGITNGTLFYADGITQINNGDYITVSQGQAGVRFAPAETSTADGSFDVESSEDGISVASQSGKATSIITLLAPASAISDPDPGPPPEDPVEDVSEEEVSEDSEVVEDVATETGVPADTTNMIALKPPQSIIAPSTAKPSLDSGVSFLYRADFDRHDDKTSNGSIHLSPQKLKMLLETKNLGELKTALGKLDITALSPADYELVRNSLDAIKDEMGQEIILGKTVLGSAIATSVGLSAGYVVWMLKGGSLLASVLSSLPAWQLADPLAILVGKKDDEDDDAESLETIIEDGSGPDEDKDNKASEPENVKKESTK
ncbi:MAG: cadherin-like domain-containing protein, partial [Deltaproteobacteria bacterium]|nr:cadherin-like domain-containing protein [Deltaproteobacteria bacterium]